MNISGVKVSVEVPLENQVQEIAYDGQEILQAPLTMSENLNRLAQRIDFKDEDGKSSSINDAGSQDSSELTFKTTPAWPWESVRNKLRASLTELCVLSDILVITQHKKYMVLDPVQAEHHEPKVAATLIYKKKGCAAASSILLSGCERLRTALNEAKSKSNQSSLPDFHVELLRLRQNWRLRKVGKSILGDLSYRTAGSRYPQSGIFEVTKASDDLSSTSTSTSDEHEKAGTSPTSALRVSVPNELQGIAYIQVLIQKDQDILSSANIGLLDQAPIPVEKGGHWQQKLEAAQNVLFCRELFSVLAREAVTLSSMSIPPLVVGNQITATLFPGILLIISLCHTTPTVGKTTSSSMPTTTTSTKTNATNSTPSTSNIPGSTSSPPSPSTAQIPTGTPKLDHNHVLEHSLHQLLREVHRQNSCIQLPHPATSPIGVSKKRRLAGPYSFDRYTLLNMSNKEGILEEIIRQAQHVVLRLRTMYVLDTLAKEIKDPLVVAHWSSLNAVTHSCVRITLLSSGYDMTSRTPLIIHVKEKSLKCILKDGKAIHLSYEPQELRDIILSQIAIHQIMALQSLSKCMGWIVLSSSAHLGVGVCEGLGNAAGCLLSSPSGKRVLAIRSSPQNGIQVFVNIPEKDDKQKDTSENNDSTMDTDSDFSKVNLFLDETSNETFNEEEEQSFPGVQYKAIRLDKLEGKNFLNKMELIMAVLSDAL